MSVINLLKYKKKIKSHMLWKTSLAQQVYSFCKWGTTDYAYVITDSELKDMISETGHVNRRTVRKVGS